MARRMHENACLFEGRGRNLSGFGNLDLVGGSVQLKILLVEDEPFILMDIELQLQQDSHFVVSASDADKAIRGSADSGSGRRIDRYRYARIDAWTRIGSCRTGSMAVCEDRCHVGKQRPSLDELPSEARFMSKPFNNSQLREAVGTW
jgi:hypothetical protein